MRPGTIGDGIYVGVTIRTRNSRGPEVEKSKRGVRLKNARSVIQNTAGPGKQTIEA
jgi:hypothetical protein